MTVPIVSPLLGLRAAVFEDRPAIDAFVRAHPESTPFHLSAWGKAVADGCGQRGHILLAERADGAIEGMLPLTEMRHVLFGKALVSNGFAVGGGVLVNSDAAAGMLAEAGWALAQKLGCPSLELRGGVRPAGDWILEEGAYLGFVRPLAASDEEELTAIPRKQRAEVRKALALDLKVTVGRSAADLKAHYAVYSESVRNLGTPVFPATLFRSVLREFGNDADILTVRHAGTPIASVLSLYHGGMVYPYWGGGTHAARALRGNDRMYFALMAHARARGCTRFDFGRSKVGTGPAAFKKNWGFEGVPLSYAKRVADGQEAREINPLSPKYQAKIALWKKLPLPVANLIGPLLARGLG
ncbi:FemAB family XrtA/PEP-CTERM system-associated protein [Sphingomonas immobilis]|uniref:FemAB family PEP-CTERM system-associated protein n=1 Tax=Sphingomonas immobilis TaxID=3063997 RepID=A0ABT9A369_9SPHN|nr:FemAB family XrtA/PEP-CTERM system-associated protein [Sphingomonas sp. CA1-15]MDO7844290.1 FemAB family PEP-CTERM system-associated protein [Sphingomonas sp. CA1-15]